MKSPVDKMLVAAAGVLLGLSAAHVAWLGGTNYVAVLDSSTNPTDHNLSVTGTRDWKVNWSIVATNPFDSRGNFSNQIPLMPGAPNMFYRLQLP